MHTQDNPAFDWHLSDRLLASTAEAAAGATGDGETLSDASLPARHERRFDARRVQPRALLRAARPGAVCQAGRGQVVLTSSSPNPQLLLIILTSSSRNLVTATRASL